MKIAALILPAFMVITGVSAQAWQIQTGDYNTWLAGLTPEAGVAKQVDLFWQRKSLNERPLNYIANFGQMMKAQFTSEIKSINSCSDQIHVDFLDSVLPHSPRSAADFEQGFLRIESANCLGRLNLDKVFHAFMDGDLQRKTIQGLKKLTVDESTNRVCQETSIIAIGKSAYCFTQQIYKNDSKYVIHSFNDENASGVDAPVYYREVITVFEKLPSDDILVYTLAYGRGPNIPFQSIVKAVIKSQQKTLIDELIRAAR